MLKLYSASTSELLLAKLTDTLKNQPLQTVFAQEIFLTPQQGMERWLSQQLAEQFGVFANYQFLQPEAFFKQLARKIDSGLHNPDFDSELLLWRLERLLHEIEDEVFLPLQQYLSGENSAVKRYQLAEQLARLFQNYQLLRPDLLAAWQEGLLTGENSAEAWQQVLWQKMTAQIGTHHQGELWQQAIAKLKHAPHGSLKYQLPERLFVFGINYLPPLWLQFLQAVAQHCEVHFYWLNALPNGNLNSANLHPLLASLGQQGREFSQTLLTGRDAIFCVSTLAKPASLLQQLQQDLSQPQSFQHSKSDNIFVHDNSISIHACHSRMREVEVLKNQLLQTLENNPALSVRDIIATAPNIQTYAPFISAVFADIPHHIAGRNLQLNSGLLDAFVRFLKLCNSRFGWQTVLDLLEQPTVYPNFDLNEADLELIKHWLSDTNVRWGKSAEHKRQLGLPPLSENTWQHSLERLLMGYAVGADANFVDAVLPYKDLEGSSAQALGGLWDFIALLFQASDALNQPKTLQTWSELLYQYADLLFAQNSTVERQALNDLLSDFAEKFTAVHSYPVDLGVLVQWLEQEISEQKSASGLLRGALTFCSINMVHGIPFQVVAILGMNDGDFPRTEKQPTFDLLAQNPRSGDPSQRADDRQQFLELLLSARQQLIITYIGQSLAQNQTIPPSVVMSELLEVLAFDYHLKEAVIKQPLQPFSQAYFTGAEAKLFSYSKADYETALALNALKPEIKSWWQGAININVNPDIELEDMFRFYRHPQRYFLRRQLDLRLQSLDADPQEREPFKMESLDSYAISHDWIDALLQRKTFDVAKLQAQGRWLSGVMGKLEFSRQETKITEFVNRIDTLSLGDKIDNLAVDLDFAGYRLSGKLSNLYENGCLFYRFSKLKGKDLLIALVQHGLLNQIQPQTTYLLSSEELLIFTPESITAEMLAQFIMTYLNGQQRPDALFSDCVLDYVRQAYTLENSTRAQKSALQFAQDKLKLSLEQNYEPELQRLYGADENFVDVLGDEFVAFCEELVLPVWCSAVEKTA